MKRLFGVSVKALVKECMNHCKESIKAKGTRVWVVGELEKISTLLVELIKRWAKTQKRNMKSKKYSSIFFRIQLGSIHVLFHPSTVIFTVIPWRSLNIIGVFIGVDRSWCGTEKWKLSAFKVSNIYPLANNLLILFPVPGHRNCSFHVMHSDAVLNYGLL